MPEKLNEFSKLSSKSGMRRTMNNLKDNFTLMKSNIKKNNIENDDSMSSYISM